METKQQMLIQNVKASLYKQTLNLTNILQTYQSFLLRVCNSRAQLFYQNLELNQQKVM